MNRSHTAAAIILASALAVSLVGCTAAETKADKNDGGTWTVLAYEIADTNLEPFMMNDVGEMGAVGTQDGLNVVAMVDRAAEYTDTAVLGIDDWVGAKVLQIDDGGATELEDLGDTNTGDPAVLANFIATGIADYPADHYSLIISDHGASWPGVGGDESADHDSLDLGEIHEAIASGLETAGVEKLDLLGFDACLMATYEVASELAPVADRMLASQELEPGHGWDYSALGYIPAHGGATADQLGAALIDGFQKQAVDEGDEAQITLSLIDLTRMDAVDSALADFTGGLVEQSADVSPVVGRTLADTLGFGRSPDPQQDSFMSDLGILAGEIGVDSLPVSDAADALVRAINDAVVDRVDGQGTKGATGLSIYFPPQSAYFDPRYSDLPSAASWSEFLGAYYSAGEEIPADEQAQFTEAEPETSIGDDGLTISGSFDLAAEGNIASATIRYGIVGDDGSVSFIGEEPATVAVDGSGTASGTYDLTQFTITDGEDTVPAYFDLTTDEDTGVDTISVPMAYYSAEDVDGETYQDTLLSITSGTGGDDLTETYYALDPELGTYGELTAEPTGVIDPQVLSVDSDGEETWASTSDTGLYADLPSLDYDFAALDSGTTVYIELSVTDFGGNSDSVNTSVLVP